MGSVTHEAGGARMGEDPKKSVLDAWNRCHDIKNLLVVDAASLRVASGEIGDPDDHGAGHARERTFGRGYSARKRVSAEMPVAYWKFKISVKFACSSQHTLTLGRRRIAVRYFLCLSVPILFFAGPIRLCRHHAGYGLRESILHGGDGLLAAAQAVDPVGHVFGRHVVDAHGRQATFAGQQ